MGETKGQEQPFTGAVVIVTGGAGGIGHATATLLHALGATVAVADADEQAARQAAAGLPGSRAYALDVSDSAQVEHVFAGVAADLGRIDGLVHSAGVSTDQAAKLRVGPQLNRRFDDAYPGIDGVIETTDEQWHRLISVNLDGTFFCVRAALRWMIPRRAGAIVTIGSNAGIVGEPGTAAYSASKGGVRIFTQAVAAEVIGYGIRVNSVAPGPTMTKLVRESQRAGQKFLTRVPARRVADAAEIAAAVAFLLGPEARFIIGETLNVNGGMIMH